MMYKLLTEWLNVLLDPKTTESKALKALNALKELGGELPVGSLSIVPTVLSLEATETIQKPQEAKQSEERDHFLSLRETRQKPEEPVKPKEEVAVREQPKVSRRETKKIPDGIPAMWEWGYVKDPAIRNKRPELPFWEFETKFLATKPDLSQFRTDLGNFLDGKHSSWWLIKTMKECLTCKSDPTLHWNVFYYIHRYFQRERTPEMWAAKEIWKLIQKSYPDELP